MSLKRPRGDPGTLASREHRGCFGKSSGEYGSIIHGMKYAKYWRAIANHSGDAWFDFVYWHDWPLGIRGSSPYNFLLLPPRPICRKARAGLLFPGGQIGC